MLTPSYSTLIRILNEDAGADTRITSRYSVVIAAAKRARQIVGGAEHEAASSNDKAVSIAVKEIQNGSIRIVPGSNGSWDFDTAVEAHNVPSLVDESYVASDEVGTDVAADDDYDDDEEWGDDDNADDDEDE